MSELGQKILQHARTHNGVKFRHHFKPEDSCSNGRITNPDCWERGLDRKGGLDCSGLGIVAASAAMKLNVNHWPRELRHVAQLEPYAEEGPGEPGDFRFHYSENGYVHMAIAATINTGVHASGVTEVVEEGVITDKYGDFIAIRSIAAARLCEIVIGSRPS